MLEPLRHDGGWGVRIWNPDGSIAEKSGNGIRILARYLATHRGAGGSIAIETASGPVHCDVGASEIAVDMGMATFEPEEIPCTERLRDTSVAIGEDVLRVTAVGMGNPHCVSFHGVPLDTLPWRAWGAGSNARPGSPTGPTSKFARLVGRDRIEARIWERGAGETSASGSSACAVAAVALLLGVADRRVHDRDARRRSRGRDARRRTPGPHGAGPGDRENRSRATSSFGRYCEADGAFLRVLLIRPPARHTVESEVPPAVEAENLSYPPLSLLSLAQFLRDHSSHEPHILDAQLDDLEDAEVERRIQALRPDVVGITVFTVQLVDVIRTVEAARRAGVSRVVLGGPHCNDFPALARQLPASTP
jgi:diaminopimelate epimerase